MDVQRANLSLLMSRIKLMASESGKLPRELTSNERTCRYLTTVIFSRFSVSPDVGLRPDTPYSALQKLKKSRKRRAYLV